MTGELRAIKNGLNCLYETELWAESMIARLHDPDDLDSKRSDLLVQHIEHMVKSITKEIKCFPMERTK